MFPWIADMRVGEEKFIKLSEYLTKSGKPDRNNTDLAACARMIAHKTGLKYSVRKVGGWGGTPEGVLITRLYGKIGE